MKPYLDYQGIAVLAHRGGSIESLENTIESFHYSKSLGCEFIETDVQVSSDGIPYIFHDETLTRLLNRDDVFSSLHSSEIDNLKIFDEHSIPKLETVLRMFSDMKFQIDVKTDEVAMPALKVIQENNAMDRVCIASFNSKRLNLVNNNYPNICISMGPNEVAKMLLSSFGLYKKSILGNCLQIPIYEYGIKLVTKRFVKYIHSMGLKVCVWTINDEKTFKYLIDLGVDGIITDKPKLLFEVLDSATSR